ncbi:MAG: glycosyltransferase family 4 protein [Candidatus Micrarchaeota archaeon]|nr:glycosyltransferase family 4 protein [Candidatus Micrarchaeota archaeon]
MYKIIEKFLLNFVDYFIIASTEIRNFVNGKGIILPLKKGIIIERFVPENVEPDSLLSRINGKILLFTGRLHDVKDPLTLIKGYKLAKKKIPDLHLVLAGDGPLKDECKKISDKDVHFLGFVDNIPSLLKSTDIFILTSVYDASPRSLMEAMAMGKPCIATRVGGVPDFIDETCGILIEPQNPKMLAEKIAYLFENPKKINELGKNARKRMLEKHNLDKNLRWIIKFLKKEIKE